MTLPEAKPLPAIYGLPTAPLDRYLRAVELRQRVAGEWLIEEPRRPRVPENTDGDRFAQIVGLGRVRAPVNAGNVASLRDVRRDLVQLAPDRQRRAGVWEERGAVGARHNRIVDLRRL